MLNMIKIERDTPPQNTVMDKQKNKELAEIKKAISQGNTIKIKALWTKDKKVKEYLHSSQHGKCCYCERKRDEGGDSDVEHFRPKAKVKENEKHKGYWWLAYEWDNLLIACKTCNKTKDTQFPLLDESKRAFKESDDIKKEKPFLINPLTENPEDFIEYDIPKNNTEPLMIKTIGKNERGKKTVNELTGINSKNVISRRVEKFKHYLYLCKYLASLKKDNLKERTKIKQVKKDIKEMQDSHSEFAGMARYYFNSLEIKKLIT